jgi:hypothetical protein
MSTPSIDNVKIILGINDTSKDQVLNLYISRSTNFVKQYCNVNEIVSPYDELIEDIAIYMYRNKGVENLQSESKGSLSETFLDGLPQSLIQRLNEFRKVRFI